MLPPVTQPKKKAAKGNGDPELICNQRELPEDIEDEIKSGFFELKQKFSANYPSSIYISHIILH